MKTLVTIIFLLMNISLFAHALRIETNPTGKLGVAQEVKIYYSEYADGQNEEFKDWYSDVTKFKLYVLAPGGEKTELPTSEGDNFRKATFTPNERGTYTLYIGHSSKDLSSGWLYQFNTAATVSIGEKVSPSIVKEGNELQIVLDPSGTKLSGMVYFKGTPLPNANVEVVAPSLWSKGFKTDSEGRFEIPSQGKGKYFLEATHVENTNGEHYGNVYEHIWRCATQMAILSK